MRKRIVSNKNNMAGIDFRINESLQTYVLHALRGDIRFKDVIRFYFLVAQRNYFFLVDGW